MACGVVSVDLHAVHQPVLSAILFWFAAAVWLLLLVVLAAPLAFQPGRFTRDARSPVSLTSVAATAVLGTRLAVQDYRLAAVVLLALAAADWTLLLPPVLRHWHTPTTGVSFAAGVATTSLALPGAVLAAAYRAEWLLSAAAALLLLALALYVFTAARFDLRQLTSGQGDHWIAGGALAIAALTAGKTAQAASARGRFSPWHQVLTGGTLVLWCLSLAWLPVLIACEAVRPRLRYDVRRWATVFPLGMYAACCFTTGQVTGSTGITRFGQVWTWVAFTATLVVLAGLVRHIRPAEGITRWTRTARPGKRSTSTGRHRNAGTPKLSTPSTPRTPCSTIPSQQSGSGAARESRSNAAGIPPPGTSACSASPAAETSGSARSSSPTTECPATRSASWSSPEGT
jgi:tellurite resistance protein TehA-like permease